MQAPCGQNPPARLRRGSAVFSDRTGLEHLSTGMLANSSLVGAEPRPRLRFRIAREYSDGTGFEVHARGHYRKHGRSTREFANYELSFRPLLVLFGDEDVNVGFTHQRRSGLVRATAASLGEGPRTSRPPRLQVLSRFAMSTTSSPSHMRSMIAFVRCSC